MKKRPLAYLIEDDDAAREALRLLLETEGIDTQGFASGERFLDAVRDANPPPDCIISDLRVSDADGGDILNLLEALEMAIPIVILSAETDLLLSHLLADRLGGRCLRKPASPKALIHTVRSALARS